MRSVPPIGGDRTTVEHRFLGLPGFGLTPTFQCAERRPYNLDMSEGARLHDRATRGETLTDDENRRLEQWYQEQDEAEAALLAAHRPELSPSAAPSNLQETLTRIRQTAQSLEALHRQNAALRDEIAVLQKRLAAKAA